LARIDEPSAVAARQILGLEQPPTGDTAPTGDRVQALLQSFYSLAQLTPDVPVPESLENRLTERLEALHAPEPPEATSATGRPPLIRRVLAHHSRLPTTAVIMLVVALVLSVGANILMSRTHDFRPEVAVHLAGTGSSPDARGVLLYDGRQIVMHASGLAELASGYRYVAWGSAEDLPVNLGTLTMLGSSTARLVARANLVETPVIVTIEPTGSSPGPSGPRILMGNTIE